MPAMHEVDYRDRRRRHAVREDRAGPREAVVAEAGAMMYIEDGIQMDTIFGDGSHQSRAASSARWSAPASGCSPANRCS